MFPEGPMPRFDLGDYHLRAFVAGDASALHALISDPAVMEFTSYEAPGPRTAHDLIRFYQAGWSRGTDARWAIASDSDNHLAGTIGLSRLDWRHRRTELGYDLLPAHWGHGVAERSSRAILDFAFGPLGLHRVEGTVMAGNARSMRVLEKLGFTHEGSMKGYKQVRGEARDYELFGIVSDDWKPGGREEPLKR